MGRRRDRDVVADRLALGEHAVLSVQEAVRWLGWRESCARTWLRDSGLIHSPDGKHDVVIWGDVIAACRGELPRRGRSRHRADLAPDIVRPAGRVKL